MPSDRIPSCVARYFIPSTMLFFSHTLIIFFFPRHEREATRSPLSEMYTSAYAKPASKKELDAISKMRSGITGTLLDDDHKDFLSDYTLLRFLRQKEGKWEKGLKLLEACIAWRCEFKPHRIQYEDVEARARELRDTYPLGKTTEGVPVIYAKPKVDRDPSKIDDDMRLMAWNFEEFHRRGFYELATVVDMSLFDRVPSSEEIKVQEKLDNMAKDYYPLMQTKVLIMFMPMLLRALFAITSALMSAAQKDIIETGVKPKHLTKWIAAEHIPVEYLGSAVVAKLEDGSYDVLGALPVGPASPVVVTKDAAASEGPKAVDDTKATPDASAATLPTENAISAPLVV
jgi:hypothetical protein